MIDFWLVASNSLWIAGLSVLLAAFSGASWVASREGIRTRTALARPGARSAISLGMTLFCAGLAATGYQPGRPVSAGRAGWEILLWAALAVVFGVNFFLASRRPR